jgi:hypothetical protein
MTNPTHASIRYDLYEADLRIIGNRLRDDSYKPRDPLYWEIVDSNRNLYTLRDPFGNLWIFDSADLDFHHSSKPETSAEHAEACVICLTGYDCPELDALEASEVTA